MGFVLFDKIAQSTKSIKRFAAIYLYKLQKNEHEWLRLLSIAQK